MLPNGLSSAYYSEQTSAMQVKASGNLQNTLRPDPRFHYTFWTLKQLDAEAYTAPGESIGCF